MAVGDVIDGDDDEESMEASIYLLQVWCSLYTDELIMFLRSSAQVRAVMFNYRRAGPLAWTLQDLV